MGMKKHSGSQIQGSGGATATSAMIEVGDSVGNSARARSGSRKVPITLHGPKRITVYLDVLKALEVLRKALKNG